MLSGIFGSKKPKAPAPPPQPPGPPPPEDGSLAPPHPPAAPGAPPPPADTLPHPPATPGPPTAPGAATAPAVPGPPAPPAQDADLVRTLRPDQLPAINEGGVPVTPPKSSLDAPWGSPVQTENSPAPPAPTLAPSSKAANRANAIASLPGAGGVASAISAAANLFSRGSAPAGAGPATAACKSAPPAAPPTGTDQAPAAPAAPSIPAPPSMPAAAEQSLARPATSVATLPPPAMPIPPSLPPPSAAAATTPSWPGVPGQAPQAVPVEPQLGLVPAVPRRLPPPARRPAAVRPQELREALETWLTLWQDCRSLGPIPAALAAKTLRTGASKLHVLRISSVSEIEVPIEANGKLSRPALAQLGRAVEQETPEALALQVRLTFLHLPAAGIPELYGHSFRGQRMQVIKARSRMAPGQTQGKLFATLAAVPPVMFFFRTSCPSRELQVLAEVLVSEDPPRQMQAGTTEQKRTWKLSSPVVKAKAKPKPKPKAKAKEGGHESVQTKPPAGGRAEASWPMSGGRYPPLLSDVSAVLMPDSGMQQPAEQEQILGWGLLRFDLASESRCALPKRKLRQGNLREQLLDLRTTRPSGISASRPQGLSMAAEAELERLLTADTGGSKASAAAASKQLSALEADVEVIPLPDAARRLLPEDLPAVAGAVRLGGLEALEDVSGFRLEADLAPSQLEPDVGFRGLQIIMPDAGWLDNLIRSLPPPAPTLPAIAGLPTAISWQLQELHALAGTHNTLRWLDEPLRGLSEKNLVPHELNDTKNMWKLKLDKQDGGLRYWFGGEVPLEFVCHADCALVLELVAVLKAPGIPAVQPQTEAAAAPLLGAPAQPQFAGDLVQNLTVGWLLLLPFYQATSEAMLKAAATLKVAGQRPGVTFDTMFFHGPGLSLSGQQVWAPPALTTIATRPDDDLKKSALPALAAGQVRAIFELTGERLVQWLQQHVPLPPPEIKPQPLQSQPFVPPPQPSLPAPLVTTTKLAQDAAMDALVGPAEVRPLPAPTVHQPSLAPAPPTSAPPAPPPPVEKKVYLRDQAVQSDPPPLHGADDNLIGEGLQASQANNVGTSTGPPSRPLGALDRARLMQDLGGDTGGPRQAAGPSVPPGEGAGPVKRELRWKFEEEDLLQADEICLELLTLRSFSPASVGERVYFQLRFFQFPPVRTSTAALAGKPGEACLLRSAVTNERLALIYHVDGYAAGPAATSAAMVHRRLVEHLSVRSADIEVWNADSGMQIGSVAMPLDMLVRQGQQVSKAECEHAVLDPVTGEARGILRLLMVNRGRPPTPYQQLLGKSPQPPPDPLQAPTPQSPAAIVPPPPSGGRSGPSRHKAKALLDPGQSGPGEAQRLAGQAVTEDLDRRKHERLKSLRTLRKAEVTDHFSDHSALLSAAEQVRQDRKREEVARRMDRFNTSQTSLLASFATPAYFSVEFTNPYGQQATFSASAFRRGGEKPALPEALPSVPPQMPLQGILPAPPAQALMMIKDPEEWRRLSAQNLVAPAPNGEFGRLCAGLFTLGPKESISLPFRYLDFEFPGWDLQPQQAPSTGLRIAEVASLAAGPGGCREFLVEVALHQGPVLRRVEVSVVPQPSAVDRTLRFYEAEGTPLEKVIALPPAPQGSFVAAASKTTGSCYVYCTDREVHVQRRDEDQVTLCLVAPQSPAVRSFFVVFYADPHFSQLVAVQLVEVQGLRDERIRVVVGQSVERTICLAPAEVLDAGSVRLHSSDPEAMTVQQAAEVDPRYGAKFTVTITAMQVGAKASRLHAVDPATRRIVAALLLVVAADAPEVKLVHNIALPVMAALRKRLLYKNEATRPLKYIIRCSEPALVAVQSPELVVNALDTRCIELLFHAVPVTLSYSAEVFLFITSEDRAIHETRMLQLTYT
eukprot:TRINITY_DN62279_c0_g1_i1.p1 TRINITY_DN62279_c0_g1~~TRINITY_DN62279_c0_g1_i1.p1  ORF type:complete len:1878 (+),score=430.77 TRINITY_DN62279_c0_g1_i1:444-6077(+)